MSENRNEGKHKKAKEGFCLCSHCLKHRAWPSQIAKLVIIIKLSADGRRWTCFHNTKSVLCPKHHRSLAALACFTRTPLPPLFIFQQIEPIRQSVKADIHWESITRHLLKSPCRPVGLWCEQRYRITHLKWAAIGWWSLEGVELQYG